MTAVLKRDFACIDNYFAYGFFGENLVDRLRKQSLNRSISCLIVSSKENKVAMHKLGTIVFALFSVAVAVSTHLCVVCRHFCCPLSLFQGHFASVSKFSPTGPQESG